eukprot:3268236-Pyramimonas_sp.AAC.1
MATINVAVLNAARLEELLMHDDLKEVDFLALQEVRLHAERPRWVSAAAQRLGWRCAVSVPPGKMR